MTCACVASFKQIQNKHTESYQEQILEYLRSTKGIFLVYGVKDKQVVKSFYEWKFFPNRQDDSRY